MIKQKKQNILNGIIAIIIVLLIGVIAFAIYYMQTKDNIIVQTSNKNGIEEIEKNVEENKDEEQEDIIKENNQENIVEEKEEEQLAKENKSEYIGKEEQESKKEENKEKSKDEKAIELAKKAWGNDSSVSFSIEEKKGNIYYVAVKSDATVSLWYEINTDTWEINEYY